MNLTTSIHELFDNSSTVANLADAAGKSAILLLLAILFSPCLRKASASVRHAFWFSALGGALTLPLFSFGLPQWHVTWLPHWSPTMVSSPALSQRQLSAVPEASPKVEAKRAEDISTPKTPEFVSTTNPLTETSTLSHFIIRWAWTLWIMGFMLTLLPVFTGWFLVQRLTRTARPLDTPAWNALLAESAYMMKVKLPIRLIASNRMTLPFTWGAFRPVVLFPEISETWPATRCRLVLLHELGHVKRLDWLTQALGSLTCAMHWFNPFAWFAARQMRLAREQACDDLVIHCGPMPKDYARELLELAAISTPQHLLNLAAVPMARRSTLEARMRAILDTKRKRAPLSRTFALATLALTIFFCASFAMLHAAANAVVDPPKPNLTTGGVPNTVSTPGATTLTGTTTWNGQFTLNPSGTATVSLSPRPTLPSNAFHVTNTRCAIFDPSGNLYTADYFTGAIYKISPEGRETTVLEGTLIQTTATQGSPNHTAFNSADDYTHLIGVAMDKTGNIYFTSYGHGIIHKISPDGTISELAKGFGYVTSIVTDAQGNLYGVDQYAHTVIKITSGGEVSVVAGQTGQSGVADGQGVDARFLSPRAIAIDPAGNFFVADEVSQTIRKISPAGEVTTIAGKLGVAGDKDGPAAEATFNLPRGLCVDSKDNIYIADCGNNLIRKLSADGNVTTVAGVSGKSGYADGSASAALFNGPRGIAINAVGDLYVADSDSGLIRIISSAGTVSTLRVKPSP